MTSVVLVLLVALLAAKAQAAMTSVSPVPTQARANQRSTKAAPGEDETHLLIYKVSRREAHAHEELSRPATAGCCPLP